VRALLLPLVLVALAAPAAVAADETAAAPARPAAKAVSLEEAHRTAVSWLLANQNPDGSWGTHRTRKTHNIWCDVPGGHLAFRTASSAICTIALRDLAPGHRTEATEKAGRRGLDFLVRTGAVKRSQPTQLYNTWALGYSLRAVAEALLDPRKGDDTDGLRRAAREIVDEIVVCQFVDGGWGYFDFRHRTFHPAGSSTPFTTATVLVGLHRAREAGIEVPERTIRRALSCMRLCRNPDGTWIYSVTHKWWRRGLINRDKGSLSRAPACAYAVRCFADWPDASEIRKGLRRLVKHHRFALAGVRRPIPHESWYSVSGYFYLYGYAYAVLALELLPEEERADFREPLLRAVLETRHPDGCYWDYPLYDYHKAYGTGYALLALERLTRIPDREGESGAR
jgi:hypothetical protein